MFKEVEIEMQRVELRVEAYVYRVVIKLVSYSPFEDIFQLID